MNESAMNVLFIMSDEHNREIAGCYGNPIVATPNIDALAARGVVFENAYCNSPICVPSRASLATGDYVHRIGYWDSAAAYDGRVPSWHHRVRDAGHDMASIGKLHYRGAADDNGMSEVHHPICIVDGIGDTHGLLRRDKRVREVARELAEEAGRGWSPYTRYDTKVADATVRWLHERKDRRIRGNNPSNWVAGEVSRCSVRARLMGRGLALRCLRGGVKSLERADARRKEGIAWLLGEPNSLLPSLQAKRFDSC